MDMRSGEGHVPGFFAHIWDILERVEVVGSDGRTETESQPCPFQRRWVHMKDTQTSPLGLWTLLHSKTLHPIYSNDTTISRYVPVPDK